MRTVALIIQSPAVEDPADIGQANKQFAVKDINRRFEVLLPRKREPDY
jgi:hypothetical protein